MTKKTTDKGTVETPIYMAFPDGVFHYVCAECTALCCRGQGFAGSLKREMPALLKIYPLLGRAAVSRQGSMLSFGTPAGRCFFLEEDNLCKIEKDHGKALKPGVCSLFPFNRFARIGSVLAISPHFMCPIRLQVPARPGHVEGTHAAVESAARASGLLDPEYIEGYMPSVNLHASLDADAVVNREISFRDRCSQSIGRRGFYQTLREQAAKPAELDLFVKRAAQILGLGPASKHRKRDNVDDLLLALAPSHRLSLLHTSSEAMLRALAIDEILLRPMMSLSTIPMTPQGANSVLNNISPAVRLLARGDEKVEFAANANLKSAPFGDADMTLSAFAALRKISGGTGVLQALEQAIKPGMPISDRSALLIQLGTQLEHTRLKRAKKRSTESSVDATA